MVHDFNETQENAQPYTENLLFMAQYLGLIDNGINYENK